MCNIEKELNADNLSSKQNFLDGVRGTRHESGVKDE